MTPPVDVLSAQQEDRCGDGRDDDEQPGDRLQTMRGRGRHERTLLGGDGTMLLVASGGQMGEMQGGAMLMRSRATHCSVPS
jgi:hypothetical protein